MRNEFDEGPSFMSDDSGTSEGTDYTKASLETQDTDHSAIPSEAQVAEKSCHHAQNLLQSPTVTSEPNEIGTDSASEHEECDLPEVFEGLNKLILKSEILFFLDASLGVLGLNTEIVMKCGAEVDIDPIATLPYIRQHAPRVSMPHIHGILKRVFRTWVFMERARGDTLQSKWDYLSDDQKSSVRNQLDSLVSDFRSIPPPPSEEPNAVYGCGIPRRCVDTRVERHKAEDPVGNEDEFNEFLISNTGRAGTPYMKMVKPLLGTNHRLVFSHGDLHPRNIMVTVTPHPSTAGEDAKNTPEEGNEMEDKAVPPAASVTVTAILDWEMCGWYPEYWEYVKALNTTMDDEECPDWCNWLPRCIGV